MCNGYSRTSCLHQSYVLAWELVDNHATKSLRNHLIVHCMNLPGGSGQTPPWHHLSFSLQRFSTLLYLGHNRMEVRTHGVAFVAFWCLLVSFIHSFNHANQFGSMNACSLIIFKYALSSGENLFRDLRKLKIVLFEVYYHMNESTECMVDGLIEIDQQVPVENIVLRGTIISNLLFS